MNNVDVTVFLVSLKAGGVALNLTEASRVYLMDSWWNPAVSLLRAKAITRVHYTLDQVEYRKMCLLHYIDNFQRFFQRQWTAFIAWVKTDQ